MTRVDPGVVRTRIRAKGFGRQPVMAISRGTSAVVAPHPPAYEILCDLESLSPLDPDGPVDALLCILNGGERLGRGASLASGFRRDEAANAIAYACEEAVGESRRHRW